MPLHLKKFMLLSFLLILCKQVFAAPLINAVDTVISGAHYYNNADNCIANNYPQTSALLDAITTIKNNDMSILKICTAQAPENLQKCQSGAESLINESEGLQKLISKSGDRISICYKQALKITNELLEMLKAYKGTSSHGF